MIVVQNVADLYTAPSTDAEVVTQAILGARVVVEEERQGFCRVATEDRYGGWIASLLLTAPAEEVGLLHTTISTLFAEVYMAPDVRSELLTKLVVGTSVRIAPYPNVGDWVPVLLPDEQPGYIHRVNLSERRVSDNLHLALHSSLRREDICTAISRQAAETAKRLVGTPYLWGGCTPFGIDCSGLTQLAYKLNGIQLLRDAHLQFDDRRFERVEEGLSLETAILEDGDLVAFSRREDKRPTHIGIALGDGRFLHARGGRGVRIDFSYEPEYGKTYVGAIRLSPNADLTVEAA